jgi:hypothetical protein
MNQIEDLSLRIRALTEMDLQDQRLLLSLACDAFILASKIPLRQSLPNQREEHENEVNKRVAIEMDQFIRYFIPRLSTGAASARNGKESKSHLEDLEEDYLKDLFAIERRLAGFSNKFGRCRQGFHEDLRILQLSVRGFIAKYPAIIDEEADSKA